MAHLHLNGVQVLTQQGYEVSYDEVLRRRGYSPNGNYQFARNAIGRAWRFQTIPLPRDEAQALASTINMLGDHWRFDLAGSPDGVEYVADDTISSVYSDKKRVPNSSDDCTVMSAYGADGARVYDWNLNPYAPFSGCKGSVLVEPGSQNRATANQFDPSTTTGFASLGGSTLGNSTSQYWTDTSCLSVSLPGASGNEGVSTTSFTGRTSYVFSAFIKLSPALITAGVTVRCEMQNITIPGVVAFTTITPTDKAGWYRIYVAGSPAGGASSSVVFNVSIVGNTTAGSIYLDGVQVEDDPGDGHPTAPIDPGSDPYGSGNGIRPGGLLCTPTFVAGYNKGITVGVWVNVQFVTSANDRYLVETGAGAPKLRMVINTSGAPEITLAGPDVASNRLFITGSVLTLGWHFIVATYSPSDDTLRLFVDGAADGTDSAWGNWFQGPWDPSGHSGDLNIGNSGSAGSDTALHPLGPVSVFPVATPASFVEKWYNSGMDDVPVPGLLPLSVHGDLLGAGEKNVKVYGQVNALNNLPIHDNTNGWESGAAVLDFTLFEATAR